MKLYTPNTSLLNGHLFGQINVIGLLIADELIIPYYAKNIKYFGAQHFLYRLSMPFDMYISELNGVLSIVILGFFRFSLYFFFSGLDARKILLLYR